PGIDSRPRFDNAAGGGNLAGNRPINAGGNVGNRGGNVINEGNINIASNRQALQGGRIDPGYGVRPPAYNNWRGQYWNNHSSWVNGYWHGYHDGTNWNWG